MRQANARAPDRPLPDRPSYTSINRAILPTARRCLTATPMRRQPPGRMPTRKCATATPPARALHTAVAVRPARGFRHPSGVAPAPAGAAECEQTITATAGAGGSIAPAGAVAVPCGNFQRFDIASDGCFAIDDVIVDGVSQGPQSSYVFINVQQPHTIEARFARLQFPPCAEQPGERCRPRERCGSTAARTRPSPSLPARATRSRTSSWTTRRSDPSRATHSRTCRATTPRGHVRRIHPVDRGRGGPGGSIQPAGAVAVSCMGSQSFAIAPAACRAIADVVVDGASVGPVMATRSPRCRRTTRSRPRSRRSPTPSPRARVGRLDRRAEP